MPSSDRTLSENSENRGDASWHILLRKHGEDTRSIASMSFEFDPLIVKQAQKIDAEKHDFVLLTEEELEELIDEKEKKEHEKP